jgi:hypothetical protein
MVLNIHFVTDTGKKAIGQLKDNFTYQDFIDMINEQFGANTHQHYTLVAKGKDLCAENEAKFNERKKFITNSVNIFVGRRMHGGQSIKKIIYRLF